MTSRALQLRADFDQRPAADRANGLTGFLLLDLFFALHGDRFLVDRVPLPVDDEYRSAEYEHGSDRAARTFWTSLSPSSG